MKTNNDKKAAQLGMPLGTATGRLRKNILFHLLQKHNEDSCYRCGRKIETVDDLTIEHKQPWLDVDPELFWDLDNISFSHLSCNVRAGRKPGPPKVCYRCKTNPVQRKPNGTITPCTSCNTVMKQSWRSRAGRN